MESARKGTSSDAERSKPEVAENNRKELETKAQEGLKDADGNLPKDQI